MNLVNGITFGQWMKGLEPLFWQRLDIHSSDLDSHETVYKLWSSGYTVEDAFNILLADEEMINLIVNGGGTSG